MQWVDTEHILRRKLHLKKPKKNQIRFFWPLFSYHLINVYCLISTKTTPFTFFLIRSVTLSSLCHCAMLKFTASSHSFCLPLCRNVWREVQQTNEGVFPRLQTRQLRSNDSRSSRKSSNMRPAAPGGVHAKSLFFFFFITTECINKA